jgi:hypothetical protein
VDRVQSDKLDADRADRLVAVARSIVGAVPFIGPAAAEVIGHVIPAQRSDRIVAMLRHLDGKVRELDQELLQARIRSEEFVDLLEDGLHQAARSLSEDRREHIAALLKNSLAAEELEHLRDKKLLWLLGELNDAEMIMLQSYGLPERDRRQFIEKHEAVLRAPPAHLGSGRAELDRAAIHDAFRKRLADLGLIRPRFKRPKRGALPEFDEKTGMMSASGSEITPLGRMLLKRCDLPTDF